MTSLHNSIRAGTVPMPPAFHTSFQCKPLLVLTAISAASASLLRENAAVMIWPVATFADWIL